MKYRELLKEIASKYGLQAVEVWDTDMDILLPEGKIPRGLRGELRRYGFKYVKPSWNPPATRKEGKVLWEEFGLEDTGETEGEVSMHVHAPMRKKKSWYDRGWDWEVPGTEGGLPGEGPYYGEDYLGRGMSSEN